MKITLSKNDFDKMVQHAQAELPDEACGLIAGIDREDGVREIKKVYCLTNIDHTNEHFIISPKDQLTSWTKAAWELAFASGNALETI